MRPAIWMLVVPFALGAQTVPASAPSGGPGFLFEAPTTSLGVSGGLRLPQVSGAANGFFGFATRELTLEASDFNAVSLRAELDRVLVGRLHGVFGAEHSFTSASSEFRDWVDQNDRPIAQRTHLTTLTWTLAARWDLTARGRSIGRFVWIPARVVPYVGAGAGAIRYALRQDGYFVDTRDLSIFRANLASKGWAVQPFVMAGVDYSLGRRLFVSAEGRYQWANAPLAQDFLNFDDGIDLSGLAFALGMHVRL